MTAPTSRRSIFQAAGAATSSAGLGDAEDAQALPPLPGRPSRIDVHCHHVPDFYRASLAEFGITEAGGRPIPDWSPTDAVTFMNTFGIAAQVVSISEPGVTYLPTSAQRNAMAQRINDYTYETLVKGSGITFRRFGSFAVLPLGNLDDPDDVMNAQAEATRAIEVLGLDGVGLYTQYKGAYLGDPRLRPLMATLDKLGAMAFIHPVTPVHPDLGLPAALFEFTFDTTRAAVNLSYSNTFTQYPSIRWLLAHAGGTLPFLAYRTSLPHQMTQIMHNTDSGHLDEQNPDYGRLFYDTALSPAPSAMRSVREVTSVSNIMFATDWPFTAEIFTLSGDPAPQLAKTFDSNELDQVFRSNALTQFPNLRKRIAG